MGRPFAVFQKGEGVQQQPDILPRRSPPGGKVHRKLAEIAPQSQLENIGTQSEKNMKCGRAVQYVLVLIAEQDQL